MLDGLRMDARRWGWVGALYVRLMERLRPVLNVSVVQVRPLDEAIELPDLPARYSAGIADCDDLDRGVEDPRLELERGFVDDAVDRDDFCAAVFHDEHMVAYAWNAVGPTPHDDRLMVHFDAPAGYSYKAFTRPEYRGRRLQNVVADAGRDEYLCRGRTMVLSFVESHNLASIASSGHRPNRRVGFAGYLCVGSRVLPFRTPGARRFGFRFVPR